MRQRCGEYTWECLKVDIIDRSSTVQHLHLQLYKSLMHLDAAVIADINAHSCWLPHYVEFEQLNRGRDRRMFDCVTSNRQKNVFQCWAPFYKYRCMIATAMRSFALDRCAQNCTVYWRIDAIWRLSLYKKRWNKSASSQIYSSTANFGTLSRVLDKARDLVSLAEFLPLNASVYTRQAFVIDQYRSLYPKTLWSLLVTLLIMIVVCAVFLRNVAAVILAVTGQATLV